MKIMKEGLGDVVVSQQPLSLSLSLPLLFFFSQPPPLSFPNRVGVVHQHLTRSTQAAAQVTARKERSQVKT